MDSLYPKIEPYESGMLDVGDGHAVYWELCGDPEGKPAVVLHGGPGSGCTPFWRRLFDPAAYRVVLLDQRGCGRSTPDAGLAGSDLSANTTHHLLDDIERLRIHLGIDRWLVLGGSWGSTLGLAYAERHRERVTEIVLFSVCASTSREVDWITRQMGRLFPEEWERFRDGVPADERDGDLSAAYARLLRHADPAVRARAAFDWCAWEDVHVSLAPGHMPSSRYQDPAFAMTFATLVTHYWSHAAWLDDGRLVRDAERLAGIPGVLINGRLDVSGPPDVAWQVSRVWREAEVLLLADTGHGAGGGLEAAIVEATDRFAGRPTPG